MIIALPLPKRPLPSQFHVDLLRAKSLDRSQYLLQFKRRDRRHQYVHMVRHHHKVSCPSPFPMEVIQPLRHNLAHLGPAQNTTPIAFIQSPIQAISRLPLVVPLFLISQSGKLTFPFLRLRIDSSHSQPRMPLLPQLSNDLRRQRIRQPKGDKVSAAFLPPMRQDSMLINPNLSIFVESLKWNFLFLHGRPCAGKSIVAVTFSRQKRLAQLRRLKATATVLARGMNCLSP